MCKIIAFTDTKKLNLKKHVNNIGNLLLKLEKDGFGYAVKGKQGVFGEKCIANHFKSRLNVKNAVNLPVVKNHYGRFGVFSELNGPGIFHGRTSTNMPGLKNTHPMQRPDETGFWHLIHNGVVTDHGEQYSKLTDNDSEDVLFRLMAGIDQVERHLTGYYAFAAIDPYGQLRVCRDKTAPLFMAWSETYETYIIATTSGLINKLNKMLDAKIGPIDEIENDVYMIFQGNDLIHHQFIQSRGWSRNEASHSEASLGVKLLPGGEVTSNGEPISESMWQSDDQWNSAIAALEVNENGTNKIREDEYYNYLKELENMDASYTIQDENDNFISIQEFRKMDHIAQELCRVIRGDGTLVGPWSENTYYKQRA
jgi:predicted glutamine amidotransferase